jgi:hypothetical protein
MDIRKLEEDRIILLVVSFFFLDDEFCTERFELFQEIWQSKIIFDK